MTYILIVFIFSPSAKPLDNDVLELSNVLFDIGQHFNSYPLIWPPNVLNLNPFI
jgi:hypothetical protein